MRKCHPWSPHPARSKPNHKLLQTLDGIDVRRPRRRQLTRVAVRKRPRIAQSGAVTGTIGHDVAAALEIGYYVVDEGIDLGLVLEAHTLVRLHNSHKIPAHLPWERGLTVQGLQLG